MFLSMPVFVRAKYNAPRSSIRALYFSIEPSDIEAI